MKEDVSFQLTYSSFFLQSFQPILFGVSIAHISFQMIPELILYYKYFLMYLIHRGSSKCQKLPDDANVNYLKQTPAIKKKLFSKYILTLNQVTWVARDYMKYIIKKHYHKWV